MSRKSDEINPALVEQATDSLRHRGPDNRGLWVSPDKKIALGYRRLSIIDTTEQSQPILHNEDKTIFISYNGEIYNFPRLRKELLGKGHQFYTQTDTEMIVHLYEEEGFACVRKLNGIFALAIYDQKKDLLFLARDHLGIKPLYYTEYGGQFAAASEIKALLKDTGLKRELNYNALAFYFNLRYVSDPLTMFKGIYKLLAGHYLIVRNGRVTEIKKYWELDFKKSKGKNKKEESVEESAAGVRTQLEKSVRMQLLTDVPLGAFLSGGIDSTVIVGLMSKFITEPVKTFSIGFRGWKGFDEGQYARLASQRFKTEHEEFQFKPEHVSLLPQVTYYLDEPLADPAALPTFVLAQMARQEVKVVLTGEGADELFRGYERDLHPSGAECLFLRLLLSQLDQLPSFRGRSYLQVRLKSPDWVLVNRVLVALQTPSLFSARARQTMHQSLLDFLKPHLDHSRSWDDLSRALYLETKIWLTGDPLMKVDKMTMANSLEARVPFLDYELVGLVTRISSEAKLGDGTSKYLLRKAARDLLPPEILSRSKQGFELPIQSWLNSELRPLVERYLSRDVIESLGLFNWPTVSGWLRAHQGGEADYKYEIWALLSFVLWHKVYFQGEEWQSLVLEA